MNWLRDIAGLLRPEWGAAPAGKVFISYRRSDCPGIAGRLADSLSEYFGDERVFRDIEDIEHGARFAGALESTLEGADALVVLIGPGWLDARDSSGARRLDDEGDWVAREIAAACAGDARVYPVLVEGTVMPRAEELPPSIRALSDYNATSIADHRWRHDVTRLAKTISFDLPGSALARKLRAVNTLVCMMLVLAMTATAAAVAWNAATERAFLTLPQAGGSYVLLFPAAVLLLVFAKEMDPTARRFATAGGLVGFLGSGTAVIALNAVSGEAETILLFVASTVITTVMLAMMSLSGFRPRW